MELPFNASKPRQSCNAHHLKELMTSFFIWSNYFFSCFSFDMITFNPAYNINFKHFKHEILDRSGHVISRGDTCLFRNDLDFDYLVNFLEYKYRDSDKVNIIAHACSDGEEIFSFISKMIDSLGYKNSKKYLPVDARDVNKSFIEIAKKGQYSLKSYETGAIDFYLGENLTQYFSFLNPNLVKVSKILKECVNFSQSDILDDVKSIDFNNTVLFARNFWHYLDDEDIDKLAMILSHRMNKTSTLIIGDFDKQYNIDRILRRYGFYETKVSNVFELYK